MNIFEELYTKDVQKSIYLRESSATIDNIYQKILGLLKEKNDIPTILDSFKKVLADFFTELGVLSYYFGNNDDHILYELLFDAYHTAYLSTTLPQKVKLRDCARSYAASICGSISYEPYEQRISRIKSDYIKESENYIAARNQIKSCTFLNYTLDLLPKKEQSFTVPVSPDDFAANILNFPSTMYHPDHMFSGIQFHDFHSLVYDYIARHRGNNAPNIELEHATYIFNKLYHAIQYQQGMISFATHHTPTQELCKNSFDIFLYTKFHDTEYLSLSNHIFQKYDSVFELFFDSDIKNINDIEHIKYGIFEELQFYNSFFLPILSLLLKEVLFNTYKEDISAVFESLHKYLSHTISFSKNNFFMYWTLLNSSYTAAANTSYKKGKGLVCSSDHRTSTYTFNQKFSISFFSKNLPNYANLFSASSKNGRNTNIDSFFTKEFRESIFNNYNIWENSFGATWYNY